MEGLVNSLINGWVGPLYLLLVAAISIRFLIHRQFRELFSFLGIAVVVGVCVYLGAQYFGKSGKLTTAADKVAQQVN